MRNKLRFMVLTIIVVLCMTAFTVPAFAGAADFAFLAGAEGLLSDIITSCSAAVITRVLSFPVASSAVCSTDGTV